MSSPDSCVREGAVLDLNNSDLLAVTVEYKVVYICIGDKRGKDRQISVLRII